MALKKRKTINFNFSQKHIDYIRRCKDSTYNIAEGSVRAGKTVDNIFAFAQRLKATKDRFHLASGSTVGNAKLNIGDANGFGLEWIFRGQCRWTKYKDNEALVIRGVSTGFKERVIIFAGGGKANSFNKIRGNSYGMWIATEINLHHESFIQEAFNRLIAAYDMAIFWDLNPSNPKHFIYENYIDKYAELEGYNYEHFTLNDNINIPEKRKQLIINQHDKNSVWYKRDILGLRVVAEGLIYESFANEQESFLIDERDITGSIYVGLDFGGNKSQHAFVATAVDLKKRTITALMSKRHIPGTPNALYEDFINFIRAVEIKYGKIVCVYADSAETVLKNGVEVEIKRQYRGIPVKIAQKKEIIDRIRALNVMITTGQFKMTRDCKTLEDALCEAVWDENKVEDTRLDDGTSDIDTLDAFEYSFERFIKALVGVV